jgi:molybdopterin-binding protein
MSKLIATITDIQKLNNLNIVNFNCLNTNLSMMSLDLGNDIKIGTKVELIVKATAVILGKKSNDNISISNQIKMKILQINSGVLLTTIILQKDDTTLESLVLTSIYKKLEFKEEDEIIAFINHSELSIARVLEC